MVGKKMQAQVVDNMDKASLMILPDTTRIETRVQPMRATGLCIE